MKVAIPLFKERVSPHFATAPELLLVQTEGARVCATWKIDLAGLSAAERRAKFLGLGIEALLCGGIDEASQAWFENHGVRVEANRMGDAMKMFNGHLNVKEHSKKSGG